MDHQLANAPHVETVSRFLRLARFVEASGPVPGFRVWPSARFPDTVYVEATRSGDRFDYESTFKAAEERLALYLDALLASSFDVVRQRRATGDRLKVSFI